MLQNNVCKTPVYKEKMSTENYVSKKIVVLIDADNAQVDKLRAIMAEIAAHGHIIVKKAYGDWSSPLLKNWKEELNFLAIQPIQQFSYTNGKNSTDIVMVIDAMDLLYTGKYDTFVLISSDSDFTSLASRLKSSEIYVYGIGEQKTPMAFRNACDDFIFTENLPDLENKSLENEKSSKNEIAQENNNKTIDKTKNKPENGTKPNIKDIISLLNIACETYGSEDGWTDVGLAGSYIKRSMPDFNSKNFGFSKLTELIMSLNKFFDVKKYQGKGASNRIVYKKKKK
jgi:uncharacterized LabA/DUF88 family protein/Fe-S-cluster formation regulator IscX/YfhJ